MNALNVLLIGLLVVSALLVFALLMTILQLGLWHLYLLITRKTSLETLKATSGPPTPAGKPVRPGVTHLTEERERRLAEKLGGITDREVG